MFSDEIISQIEEIGQEFLDWIPNATEEDYWKIVNGKKYFVAETDGFIKWLNSHYCSKIEQSYVVARNVNYCSLYKVIEF